MTRQKVQHFITAVQESRVKLSVVQYSTVHSVVQYSTVHSVVQYSTQRSAVYSPGDGPTAGTGRGGAGHPQASPPL